MKIKTLTAALACALPMTGAFAAALDRSGQSISPFLQSGNYFEAGVSILSPNVEGRETDAEIGQNRKIDDMANDYLFPNAAVKLQINDLFSFGLIYDQPFGASAAYSGDNFFVASPTDTVLPQARLDAMAAQKVNDTVTALMSDTTLPAGHFLAAQQQQVRQMIGDVNSGGTLQALTVFANANLGGNVALAQQLYSGNVPPVAGGPGLADLINPTVRQQATANVTQLVQQQVQDSIDGVNNTVGGTGGGTRVSVKTENLSMLFGVSPIKNFTFYAGPVFQTVEGDVSLRGQAYSIYNGYDAKIKSTDGWGWLAGAAYQIPEIALKASITYRSEIDHDSNIQENLPTLGALALLYPTPAAGTARAAAIQSATGETKITTPKSVNLDLQSGIMADTVAFANIRWVNWKDFAIQPYKFGLLSKEIGGLVGRPNGFNLVEYSEDQWSVTAGVGRKLSAKWAGNVSVGWDSGAGDPTTTLGPTEGYYNVGIGVQYSPAENYFVAGGVKYFWLGDADAQTGAQAGGNQYVASFKDNTAMAFGLKLGYRF